MAFYAHPEEIAGIAEEVFERFAYDPMRAGSFATVGDDAFLAAGAIAKGIEGADSAACPVHCVDAGAVWDEDQGQASALFQADIARYLEGRRCSTYRVLVHGCEAMSEGVAQALFLAISERGRVRSGRGGSVSPDRVASTIFGLSFETDMRGTARWHSALRDVLAARQFDPVAYNAEAFIGRIQGGFPAAAIYHAPSVAVVCGGERGGGLVGSVPEVLTLVALLAAVQWFALWLTDALTALRRRQKASPPRSARGRQSGRSGRSGRGRRGERSKRGERGKQLPQT